MQQHLSNNCHILKHIKPKSRLIALSQLANLQETNKLICLLYWNIDGCEQFIKDHLKVKQKQKELHRESSAWCQHHKAGEVTNQFSLEEKLREDPYNLLKNCRDGPGEYDLQLRRLKITKSLRCWQYKEKRYIRGISSMKVQAFVVAQHVPQSLVLLASFSHLHQLTLLAAVPDPHRFLPRLPTVFL